MLVILIIRLASDIRKGGGHPDICMTYRPLSAMRTDTANAHVSVDVSRQAIYSHSTY